MYKYIYIFLYVHDIQMSVCVRAYGRKHYTRLTETPFPSESVLYFYRNHAGALLQKTVSVCLLTGGYWKDGLNC